MMPLIMDFSWNALMWQTVRMLFSPWIQSLMPPGTFMPLVIGLKRILIPSLSGQTKVAKEKMPPRKNQ